MITIGYPLNPLFAGSPMDIEATFLRVTKGVERMNYDGFMRALEEIAERKKVGCLSLSQASRLRVAGTVCSRCASAACRCPSRRSSTG